MKGIQTYIGRDWQGRMITLGADAPSNAYSSGSDTAPSAPSVPSSTTKANIGSGESKIPMWVPIIGGASLIGLLAFSKFRKKKNG